MTCWAKAATVALAVVALGAGVAIAHDRQPYPGGSHEHSGSAPQQSGDAPAKAKLTWNKNYLSAVMDGKWELGEKSTARGSAAIHVIDESTICYGLTVKGLADGDRPADAHIHKGKINQNGPIVIKFENVPEEGDPGWGGGCTQADPAVIRRVQRAPVKYYVNVHSDQFKDGALRGQLAWTRWFQPVR
jgi:CHRD domain